MNVQAAPAALTAPAEAKPKAKRTKKAEPPPPVPIEPIKLYPSQEEHVVRLNAILKKHPFALDFSMLGAGKTYTASHIALHDGFKHVIVIAPVSVKPKWDVMKSKHGVPVRHNLSYCELRTVKCKQPKHGLLHRRDYTIQMTRKPNAINGRPDEELIDVDKVEFTPSEQFKTMVAEGVLLIMDEIQNVKNITSQFAACQALIKTIVTADGGKSKALLLSGSPIDKECQAVHMFRTLHVMKSDMLAVFDLRDYTLEWRGMNDIVTFCEGLDNFTTQSIVALSTNNREGEGALNKLCYRLFQDVVKNHVSSSMMPPSVNTQLIKRNAYYFVRDESSLDLLANAVGSLGKASGYDGNRHTVHFANTGVESLRQISRAMLQIETAKITTFNRIAREMLLADPNRKVVICVNYTATIGDLVAQLAEFNPLVLNGELTVGKRKDVLDKFQAGNTKYRLLIGNMGVCSTGIDLDDKFGTFPRFALVNPNYSTISLYQLAHRFQRADSRSDATIYCLYGKQTPEVRILDALARKSNVMKETVTDQVRAGIVFPGDYEAVEEDDPPATV